MARFSRESWLDLGLEALAEAGPEALTIEALCARASLTRGSFYHHFAGVEAYLTSLAQHWHQRDTESIIRLNERETQDRLEALNRLTSALDHRLEQAMRRLGAQHESVRAVIHATDKRRMGYLVKLHIESGDFEPEAAELLAQVTYAAFIGFQQIAPDMPPEASRAAYRRFMALVSARAKA